MSDSYLNLKGLQHFLSKLDERYLKLSGGNMTGHIYMTGSNASSSTSNTTQLVFGTSSTMHAAISSNSDAIIINPKTNSTTGQIILKVGSDPYIKVNGTAVSLSGHTHSYAGSSSAGGAATSANKINTDAGSATNPVYFSGGVPVACTYSLSKSVPSNAVFTDTTYTAGTGLTLSSNQFSVSSANASTILNLLTTGSSTPTDADYYISQYVGGGTTTTTYHRRPMSALWAYIKGKGDSTYLGISATAADSTKLNGQAASYYLNYNNFTNTPTIPTVSNATITIKQTGISDQTFTLNGSATTITLADTNTWRPLGTGANDACAGNDSRLSNSRTPTSHASTATTYGAGTTSNYGHVKLATGDMKNATDVDGVACSKNHTHSQYYLATNPNGYTSNNGTVTSVRVQAGTGLSSSQSTAQTSTLNTTISIASGYKLPTTTEWNGKANTADLPQVTFSTTALTGGTTVQGVTIGNDKYNFPTGGGSSTDTWRNIKVNGTEKLGTATNTGAVDFQQGSNVTLSYASGVITIAATDTTYESKTASSGGTAVSLCTTGEKYTWNNKQNALPTTTTANKVLISTTTSGTTKWSDFSSAGFLKTSNTGVLSVDTNTYLTGNQTITLSGAVTGSGTTSITTTLANSGVTADTYTGITVNAKGIVTSAAKRYEHNIRVYYSSSNISVTFKIINGKSDAYTYQTLTVSNNHGLYASGFTSGTTVCPACGLYTSSSVQGLITGVYGYNSTGTYRLYFRYTPLVSYSSSTATINNTVSGETTTYVTLTSSFTINDVVRTI